MSDAETMDRCIQACWTCRHECQITMFDYCLEMGGRHVEPDHIKIMTDCIEICQIAADSMVRHSPVAADICRACMATCEACATSCETLAMQHCAEECYKCADACREMAGTKEGGIQKPAGHETHPMA